MRRQRRFRSEHGTLGTLQNPGSAPQRHFQRRVRRDSPRHERSQRSETNARNPEALGRHSGILAPRRRAIHARTRARVGAGRRYPRMRLRRNTTPRPLNRKSSPPRVTRVRAALVPSAYANVQ